MNDMKSSTTDKLEGSAKSIAGHIKEAAGKVTGNETLKAEGRAETEAGRAQRKLGDIKKILES